MPGEIPHRESPFQDENAIRWAFLEQESDACAVVSERMELLYLNEAGRALTLPDWFAKRCFEVLPNRDEHCAWHCPTITAVSDAQEITYCEEALSPADGAPMTLGTAVIPLEHAGVLLEDRAGERSEQSALRPQSASGLRDAPRGATDRALRAARSSRRL